VLGAGGVGKTALAAAVARAAAPAFAVVYWRSLRNAPPVEEWLVGAIAALSAGQAPPPDGQAARLDLLLELLRARRGLLVLDNVETILEPGAREARYREGYAGYGEVLRRVGEGVHQGCLLLTGREAPPELAPPAGERTPARTLHLRGLGREAGRALLRDRGLVGDEAAWDALVARYNGNPLALRVVGETIAGVFGGAIAPFLAQDAAVFGGIRHLLDAQVGRLSALEHGVLSALAVAREPVGFAELVGDLGPGVGRGEAVEAVEALQRRSLLEWGAAGAFTLQPVVLEYVTTRLIAALAEEILAGEPALLARQAVLQSQARDYVRRSQERLIAQPLLARLRGQLGGAAKVEERLLALLAAWRGQPAVEQANGPGNAVNLLRLLRGDLRGLDLSDLVIRQAYLQEVEAQGASLARARLSEAVLAEAFTYPLSVALSADGAHLAAGTSTGAVWLWRVADRTPLLAASGHTGGVWGVALSGDGRLAASAGEDGTVRLWEAAGGAWLRTLRAERSYERLDITGLTGVTEAQRAALLALGAVEGAPTNAARPPSATAALLVPPPSAPEPAPARPPTNLPPARTSFVGRTADLASLRLALDPTVRTGTRLLTLTGVAGCGKTRLALAVAEAVRDANGDGVWLVELAPLPAGAAADPTPVAAALLTALGLREQPGQDLLDTLVGDLRPRRLLLVLDNCEHVAAAAAALAARLLASCPRLRILATSQRPLGIAEETLWPVGTLGVPPPVDGAPTPEVLRRLGQSDAVRLFVERAAAVQPGFVLSAATAAGVAALCRRLDGLPLAIELAAARLHVLPVTELLARLDDRFRLLRRGGRGATDRHRTLQATMDWSYGLLEPAERALLRRLAAFAGGWEVAAAEAVLELLDELLERSLVYVQPAAEAPRYGLLETVRQHGLQQMERAGETAEVRDRHLEWCVALVEQAAPALPGAEQGARLSRLAREHDNLRAALQWALTRGRSAGSLRLAGGLTKFWLRGGHQSEGRRWLAAVLALPAEGDDATDLAARATALDAAAWLAEDQHDFGQASALFAQSGALRRALGQQERPGAALINAALEARAAGDYTRATALLEESLTHVRRPGNRAGVVQDDLVPLLSVAYPYVLLALVLREQGAYARATALCEECLALTREVGDAEGRALALLNLADLARDQGDTGRVRAYGEESLALFRELGQPWAIGFALNNLALAACREGDLAQAERLAEESAAIFREREAGPSLAEVLVTLGRVRGAQWAAAAAGAHLSEALALPGVAGPRLVTAAALEELGTQAVRRGQVRHGVRLLAAATQLRGAMGAPLRPADRPAIEAALATARASLGDLPFEDAWATGQALPLEQVVAQAVAGPEGEQLDVPRRGAAGPEENEVDEQADDRVQDR
jgi:predicted ATPase